MITHPYDEGGGSANTFQLLELSAEGSLTTTTTTFEMRRAAKGIIAFTPDGRVGLAVQDDGTLGVFTIDAGGEVQVKHAGFGEGIFQASRVIMDTAGEHAWVLDEEWREAGGGIYRVGIGCDGTLRSEGLYAAGKLPGEMLLVPGTAQAVVAAHDLMASEPSDDVHLVQLTDTPSLIAGVDGFPAVSGEDASISSAALTSDGKYALVGDNSATSGIPNRVAVVEVSATGVVSRQLLSPVPDPVALIASPFGSPILAVDGLGGAIRQISYDPADAVTPFELGGEVTYEGAGPQLPGKAVVVDRGGLAGRVLLGEYSGVRQLAFHRDGTVTDLGLAAAGGTGAAAVVGAIGVQP